jgi:hypothetical protein
MKRRPEPERLVAGRLEEVAVRHPREDPTRRERARAAREREAAARLALGSPRDVMDDHVQQPARDERLEVEHPAAFDQAQHLAAEQEAGRRRGEEPRDHQDRRENSAGLSRDLPEEEALRHLVEDDGDAQRADRLHRVLRAGLVQRRPVEDLMNDEAEDDDRRSGSSAERSEGC